MLAIDPRHFAGVDDALRTQVRNESRSSRQPSEVFARNINQTLLSIQNSFADSADKKAHVVANRESQLRQFTLGFINDYLRPKNDQIEFDRVDWSLIELFLGVTEGYFKKMEITKGMKAKANDATDWLNMLYVRPSEKYLTFEKAWRNYILDDPRISHYLYQ